MRREFCSIVLAKLSRRDERLPHFNRADSLPAVLSRPDQMVAPKPLRQTALVRPDAFRWYRRAAQAAPPHPSRRPYGGANTQAQVRCRSICQPLRSRPGKNSLYALCISIQSLRQGVCQQHRVCIFPETRIGFSSFDLLSLSSASAASSHLSSFDPLVDFRIDSQQSIAAEVASKKNLRFLFWCGRGSQIA